MISVGGAVAGHVQKRSDNMSASALEPEVMRMASQITSLSADVTTLKNQAASCQAMFGESVLHDRTSYGDS